ncbi:MAG: response regulator transcription factor [Actinomycetota bacterium]
MFARAHEFGFDPQPGLALLRLAQGKAESALKALHRSVEGEQGNRLARARLLAALVDVALAADDHESARGASRELDAIARELGTPALEAAAATAGGALLRAGRCCWRGATRAGPSSDCGTPARSGGTSGCPTRRPWPGCGTAPPSAPPETRRTPGSSCARRWRRSNGSGRSRTRPGRAAFLEGPTALPHGLTAREAEVLRLVAAGKTNRDIAAELVISEHTVARHLQNMFAKLRVSSRSAATAFAFEHGLA